VIENTIYPSGQNKFELLNIAKSIPFNHVSFQLSY
jgi:hypothetical protein